MRVLVCGGRCWGEVRRGASPGEVETASFQRSLLFNALDSTHRILPITLLISGGAKGADTHAVNWAKSRKVPYRVFEPLWDVHGKPAGIIRNRQMLDEGKPDIVIAFPGGRGTAHMIKIASEKQVHVRHIPV